MLRDGHLTLEYPTRRVNENKCGRCSFNYFGLVLAYLGHNRSQGMATPHLNIQRDQLLRIEVHSALVKSFHSCPSYLFKQPELICICQSAYFAFMLPHYDCGIGRRARSDRDKFLRVIVSYLIIIMCSFLKLGLQIALAFLYRPELVELQSLDSISIHAFTEEGSNPTCFLKLLCVRSLTHRPRLRVTEGKK